jgi:fucose permease
MATVREPANRLTVTLLYLSGVVQGLALVTFPAASAIFTSPTGFHLTGAEYGEMFIPQVVLAILASSGGPLLARRLGLRGVLLLGLAADCVSMALLATSPLLIGASSAFALLCVSTGALGLGFGATVMALNTAVEGMFPGREDGAVLALNALLGVGTALAPLLVALFNGFGIWWALPLLMAVCAAILIASFVGLTTPFGSAAATTTSAGGLPGRFWLYAGATLLYGIVETLSGNWGMIYLSSERHVAAQDASFALTAFWLMVTLGRVLFALLGRFVPARWVYVALPVGLAIVFAVAAQIGGSFAGIAVFGAAGLACSAFLPLSISLAGAEFPSRAATMSGNLIAVYQVGYGVAAFGVGPLHGYGFSYAAMFLIGSGVALCLAILALGVAIGTGQMRRNER